MKRALYVACVTAILPLGLVCCSDGGSPPEDVRGQDDGGAVPPDADVGDRDTDASSCAQRGTRVEGVAPVEAVDMRVLTRERVLYMSAPSRGRGAQNLQIARVSLGATPGPKEYVRMGNVFQEADADGMAYSREGMVIAVGGRQPGAGGNATLALVSTRDPGWGPAEGAQAQDAALGDFPEHDAGGTVESVPAVVFIAGRPLFATGVDGRGATVLARRASTNTLEIGPDVRLEPRVLRFDALVAAPDGGAWAAGVTLGGRAALVKLTKDNTIETGAAGGGFVELASTSNVVRIGVGVDPLGRVYATTQESAPGSLVLHRLRADGGLDSTFGTAGVLNLPIEMPVAVSLRVPLVVERSGAVIIGGRIAAASGAPKQAGFIRILPDGQLDPRFGGAGPYLLEPGADRGADLQPRGAALVAAPADACEGELLALFGQNGAGKAYLFH